MWKMHKLENEQNQKNVGFTKNKYDVPISKIVSKKDKKGKIILINEESDISKSEKKDKL
jgi:hypothetical protein